MKTHEALKIIRCCLSDKVRICYSPISVVHEDNILNLYYRHYRIVMMENKRGNIHGIRLITRNSILEKFECIESLISRIKSLKAA